MELLLWRWSVVVQWTSLAMIAVFFAALASTIRLAELRSWAAAWACNLAALGVTFVYWNWRTGDAAGRHFPVLAASYMLAKSCFVVLLIHGAMQLRRPGVKPFPLSRVLLVAAAYGIAGLTTPSLEVLGVVQNLVAGVLFTVGGVLVLRAPREVGASWLGLALLFRAALSVITSGLFVTTVGWVSVSAGFVLTARSILASLSFIDAGAEWLLALASVLALSDRMSGQLRQYNTDLLAAQEDLRRLADRDPLTALANRRALPEVFRSVQPNGALVLFLDLDGFKGVNDRFGHQVGDECLRRFALHLRECFRPSDALLRYGGDEFLVVAPGLDAGGARERVERLRETLRRSEDAGPEVVFSVGMAVLPPGGQPEVALAAADQSMYANKGERSAS